MAIAVVIGCGSVLHFSIGSYKYGGGHRELEKLLPLSGTLVHKPAAAREHPRRIFMGSGWDIHHGMITDLFPNFKGKVVKLEWPGMEWEKRWSAKAKAGMRARNRQLINETATEDDLLMGNILRAEFALADCLNTFPGKQMYLNVEPVDFFIGGVPGIKEWGQTREGSLTALSEPYRYDYLPPSDKIFVLGPHHDTNTSVRLTYAQQFIFWDLMDPDVWSKLLYKKPKNTKEHFLIYLATHYIPFREKAAWNIAQIGKSLHTNGHCEGNHFSHRQTDGKQCTAHPEPRPSYITASPYLNATDNRLWADSSTIYANYRFALVMENTLRDGYITEKIVNAFIGGAIPIWYGTRNVFDIFNEKAFIYYDVHNAGPALDRIAFLESNQEAYDAMLSEPILKNGEKTIEEYFSLRDDVGGGVLKNRILQKMGYATPSSAEKVASIN